jgi:uncharacterized phage infection (PIP) family protein YhgE
MTNETTITTEAPKTPRKRTRKPAQTDIITRIGVDFAAKAKQLDKEIKELEKEYGVAKEGLNKILDALQKKTAERDRVVVGHQAIVNAQSSK